MACRRMDSKTLHIYSSTVDLDCQFRIYLTVYYKYAKLSSIGVMVMDQRYSLKTKLSGDAYPASAMLPRRIRRSQPDDQSG